MKEKGRSRRGPFGHADEKAILLSYSALLPGVSNAWADPTNRESTGGESRREKRTAVPGEALLTFPPPPSLVETEHMDRINELWHLGESRRAEHTQSGLYPSGIDWLTSEEREELHTLLLAHREEEQGYRADVPARVAAKRRLRRQGIAFDPEASLAELEAKAGK